MRIESKEQGVTVSFKDLKEGDVFCSENVYYMKTEEDFYGDGANAIALIDGSLVEFGSAEEVAKVNATLVIG